MRVDWLQTRLATYTCKEFVKRKESDACMSTKALKGFGFSKTSKVNGYNFIKNCATRNLG